MDGLFLKTAIHSMTPAISAGAALDARAGATHMSAVGRSPADKSTVAAPSQKALSSRFSFRNPLRSLWPGRGGIVNDKLYNGLALDEAVLVESSEGRKAAVEETGTGREMSQSAGHNGNWVLKILQIKSLRSRDEQGTITEEETKEDMRNEAAGAASLSDVGDVDDDTCDVCRVDDEEEKEIEFDRDSFSRMLRKVSLAEAKVYARMSYLGNLAYSVSKIKPGNLLKYCGLRFVTSSVEKRELSRKAEKSQNSAENHWPEENAKEEKSKDKKINGNQMSASVAYEIAASAASYLQSHTASLLPFKSSRDQATKDTADGSICSDSNGESINSEVASLMATTDSVTAVVAAKEEVKQAVADDLNSTQSSPCEWFICDDEQTGTRFFVIQGSESLASWQANLLFEPIQFEGLDVLVHRGIYEAAKGIYEQMLPEAQEHLRAYGSCASFRFTGHSLGGSLSLLISLMLLIRGEVPASSLLPVITFGSPTIMCGGDRLLRKLGLPQSHVQAITMHRDIVPRAFSCHYPNHVSELLKAVNGNFRNHPCLNNQKLLYAPMGELLILQPDEKFSPHHHLLPSESGLYLLSCPLSNLDNAEKQLRAAQMVFLNSPHPLEILSDRSAYGSEGAIQRDHDMNSYSRAVRAVVRQELNRIRKARRENRRKMWWPLVLPRRINSSTIVGTPVASIQSGQEEFNFSGILQSGRESLRRFSRLIASQHMHLFVLMLFPAKVLLVGAYKVIRLH